MPTVPQLPAAPAVGPNDQLMVSQGGQSVSVTTQVLLASTQPQLTLSGGTLLGRVGSGSGGPEVVPLGSGLVVTAQGSLAADTTVMAPLSSPALTGRPTGPTQPAGDNSQALATTAFVASSNPPLVFVGDVVGSGSSPVTLVLPPIINPGVYSKVTVNGKGQVTTGGSILASDIVAALGYMPASASSPPALAGANASAALVYSNGSTVARSLGAAVSDTISVLAFGADPTGGADSAPAFTVAMSEIPQSGIARLFVPRGIYHLASVVNAPTGRSITVEFDEGATITGPGYLGVDRVETHQGPFRLDQVGGGFAGYTSGLGAPGDLPFDYQIVTNSSTNSASNPGPRIQLAQLCIEEAVEIAGRPSGDFPAQLDGFLVLGRPDEVEGEVPDDRHVLCSEALPEAGLVFCEADVEHPVQAVLRWPSDLAPPGVPFERPAPRRRCNSGFRHAWTRHAGCAPGRG